MSDYQMTVERNDIECRYELTFSNGKKVFASYMTDVMLERDARYYVTKLFDRLAGGVFVEE